MVRELIAITFDRVRRATCSHRFASRIGPQEDPVPVVGELASVSFTIACPVCGWSHRVESLVRIPVREVERVVDVIRERTGGALPITDHDPTVDAIVDEIDNAIEAVDAMLDAPSEPDDPPGEVRIPGWLVHRIGDRFRATSATGELRVVWADDLDELRAKATG